MRQLLILAAILFAGPALAHTGQDMVGGFTSGFTHPIFGWDHVVAMVAVGLWGAFLGKPALWLLPITFPLVMAIGAAFGIAGMPLPFVEIGIALSGVVLGLAVALSIRAPLGLVMVMVGVFAMFHGHAHGVELPEAANPIAYAFGFVIATGLLHMSGIALGLLTRIPNGQWLVRAAGLGIAAVGGMFLTGMA